MRWSGRSGARPWERGRLPVAPRLLALVGILALAFAGGAFLIGQQLAPSSASRHPPKRAASSTSSELAQFQDPAGAFTLSYPSSWQLLPPTDSQVVLLAASGDGASLLVRKTPIGPELGTAAARKLADRVVRSGKNVTYLRAPQQVRLGGLPGFLYLYTFDDPSTGARGAHAHYFLFQGTTLITLVFQALPADRILSLASLFDRVAGTFRALPG